MRMLRAVQHSTRPPSIASTSTRRQVHPEPALEANRALAPPFASRNGMIHAGRGAWRMLAVALLLSTAAVSASRAAPVRTLPNLASITFIENTGANREYTFLPEDSKLLTRLTSPIGTSPIRTLSDLESITITESSGSNHDHEFDPDDPRLQERLADPLTGADFFGVAGTERYDVFYSNADGTLNPEGAYLTIEAVFAAGCPSGGAMNISEVRLDRTSGPQPGSSVENAVYWGRNASFGSHALAIDGNLNTDSNLGNTTGLGNRRLRLTIGFGLTASDFESIADEYYDVFYSDDDGTPNVNGAYLTVEAVFASTGPGGGLNLSEIRLNRGPQSEYGNVVEDAVYNGTNQTAGSASFAIDGNPATDSEMGNTSIPSIDRLRVTIGFASSSGGTTNPTRYTATLDPHLQDIYVTSSSAVHVTNHLSQTGQLDWEIDTGGLFEVQPPFGTVTVPPGTTTIDLTTLCDCLVIYGTVQATFRTTNLDGDNVVATASWQCDRITGAPGFSPFGGLALLGALTGAGAVVLRRRARERASHRSAR